MTKTTKLRPKTTFLSLNFCTTQQPTAFVEETVRLKLQYFHLKANYIIQLIFILFIRSDTSPTSGIATTHAGEFAKLLAPFVEQDLLNIGPVPFSKIENKECVLAFLVL